MSLSESLMYAPKPSAILGHKFRQNLPTYNKVEFLPGDTMMLNIPCGRKGQFLNQRMSFIKFKPNTKCVSTTSETAANPVVAAAPITPAYSGSSLFVRLESYHGFNLLEQIHEHDVLHALWSDMTGSAEAQKSTRNILDSMDEINPRTGDAVPLNGGKYYILHSFAKWHFFMHAKQVSPNGRHVRNRPPTRDNSRKCR
jgi:hypothetical protein